ncbi:hypothetical protein [Aeromicrobium sp. Sec7.5]|uniref:hypothetical protein n=1 Tax=Aeromicrobium sp. Sec7.5 TaxID=3121276 RepID=UPI002FE4A18C
MDDTSAAFTFGVWMGRLLIVGVGLALLAFGILRSRRDQGGAGGWIAAGVLVALLGTATAAIQVVEDRSTDGLGPPAIEDTSVPQVFASCDEAIAAVQASLDQVVVEAEAGRVAAMRSATFTMLRIPTDNPTCFDPTVVAEFESISAAKPDDENLDYSSIDEECWVVARDAATLTNFAAGFGQGVPDLAERVLSGLTVLSETDPQCLSTKDAAEMADQAREAWS